MRRLGDIIFACLALLFLTALITFDLWWTNHLFDHVVDHVIAFAVVPAFVIILVALVVVFLLCSLRSATTSSYKVVLGLFGTIAVVLFVYYVFGTPSPPIE
jgi:amino acid permease